MGPFESQHSRPAFAQRVRFAARTRQRGSRFGASPFRALGHTVCALDARSGRGRVVGREETERLHRGR
eukprot:scaffold15050_cov141-Isochrysis_galbana.AAC.2